MMESTTPSSQYRRKGVASLTRYDAANDRKTDAGKENRNCRAVKRRNDFCKHGIGNRRRPRIISTGMKHDVR
jgi:hypothetical protein